MLWPPELYQLEIPGRPVMNTLERFNRIAALGAVLVMTALTACGQMSIQVKSIKSGEELQEVIAETDRDYVVVFGRVRWIEDEKDIMGEGFLPNNVSLALNHIEQDMRVDGIVGSDGLFAWVLEPGGYRLWNVMFQKGTAGISEWVFYRLSVPKGKRAVYSGTLNLETTRKRGWTGTKISIDRMSVADECDIDCPEILARLNLPADSMHVSLLQYDEQLAQSWAKAQE
jgi:hypothetical protein